MKSKPILVNARILTQPITGVQRYLLELLRRWEGEYREVSPSFKFNGVKGHFWEQVMLPLHANSSLLFSPSNTGPVAIKDQVVTLHDVVPFDHPEWLNKRFAAWYKLITPMLLHNVRHVITISEFSKQRILNNIDIPEEKITVIHNGVDERFRPHSPEEIDILFKTLKLPSKKFVLSLGSLEPRKNLARLLKAWNLVYRKLPDDVWLVVTGKPGSNLVFKNVDIPTNLPRVHFTGHVEDKLLPLLYAAANSFAYLSVYEGFGLPPLEAMASGTPVLTGDRTALREVVGDSGLMVDPFDVDAIAEGLTKVVNDNTLSTELIRRGLIRSKHFDWNVAAKKTLSLLRAA